MADQNVRLNARYYPESTGTPPIPGDLTGKVAVCFSGGGSRACTAAMGQMRALHQLNLLDRDKIGCISSVSGGTWASILYAFRPAEIDIETFLGGVVDDPSKLTWDDHSGENKAEILDYLDINNLGMVPTRLGLVKFLKTIIQLYDKYKYPASDLWIRAVGKLVLEPFGISKVDMHGAPLKYMGYTPEWITNDPVMLNPGKLAISDFEIVPSDPFRPYLVTNTSLFANPETLVPYEISPVYQGIFNHQKYGDVSLGGGFLDTYVFGSSEPQKQDNDTVSVQSMNTRPCPADAAGLSSAFFAVILENLMLKGDGDITKLEEFKELHFLDKEFKELSTVVKDVGDLIPQFPYWPVEEIESDSPTAKIFQFADGGNLQNYGILPMLQRGSTSIICFINTSTKLEEGDHGLLVDSNLPPLFGYVPISKKGEVYKKYADLTKKEFEALPDAVKIYAGNQVFPSTEFFPLLNLLAAASKGKSSKLGTDPVMCIQPLTTVYNEKWGVQEGISTRVLWSYNNPVDSWRSQLSWEVRSLMDFHYFKYDDFPNYNTVTKVHLDARQVNLLAHLSCWNILQKQEMVLSMWDSNI